MRDKRPSGHELGPLAGYLRYKRIMKGRRGCPLQVYAGPPAGDLGSVLSGASCGENKRGCKKSVTRRKTGGEREWGAQERGSPGHV